MSEENIIVLDSNSNIHIFSTEKEVCDFLTLKDGDYYIIKQYNYYTVIEKYAVIFKHINRIDSKKL